MIEIGLAIQAGDWPEETELLGLCSRAVKAAKVHLSKPLPEAAEVSFLFTSDAHVQALNLQWRDQDKPTNVLSFASNDEGGPPTPLLGDVALAFETVEREARQQQKQFDHHLTHLLIHGFLHLLGYDHVETSEAERMESLEIKILADLGVDNPYIAESDA